MRWPLSGTYWKTDRNMHSGRLHLTKHHGLANDFLIALDEANDGDVVIDGALARRLCDRRTGLGADGLIRGGRPADGSDADVVMHLFNADGTRAEMSGNGIRCLAHAVALARGSDVPIELTIATDAGTRRANIGSLDAKVAEVSVSMGPARPGPDVPEPLGERLPTRHVTVDFGNPHLVIEVPDPGVVDLTTEGAWLSQQFPDGINVEYVAASAPDRLTMRVWERGVGITEACGTGACAAAHAAGLWGLIDGHATVAMPGGLAEVSLGDDVVLTGPSELVARIEVHDG
jgi:diaminopimelate epimerase